MKNRNLANIRKTVALMIERGETFDQDFWMHPCGSPACIAGYVVIACGGKLLPTFELPTAMNFDCTDHRGERRNIRSAAREYLGIGFRDQSILFDGDPFGTGGGEPATLADAVETLEHLHDTGEVRWIRSRKRWVPAQDPTPRH